MKTTKNNTIKNLITAGLIAGLSVTTLASNVDNLIKADDNKIEVKADVAVEKAVNVEVVEKDSKVFVVVTAKEDVQKATVKPNVDGIKYENIVIGDMKKGEVKEVELEMPVDGKAPTKSLPNTAVVSDSVEFNKEIQGHKIKGTVTFEINDGVEGQVEQTATAGVIDTPAAEYARILNGVVGKEVPTAKVKANDVKVAKDNKDNKGKDVATDSNGKTPSDSTVKPSEPTTKVSDLKPLEAEKLQELDAIIDAEHKGHKFEYKVIEKDVATDLPVEYVDDATLEIGKVVLKAAGSPMVIRSTYNEVYVDGVHVAKYDMLIDRVEIAGGEAKVYLRGTKKVETPKVEEPKVETPKVEEPKVETPKVEEPKVETPKVEEPKVETPKVEEPKVETPKVEEPKVETPKVDEPKVETPKVDEPKVETPKVDEPKVETPKVDEPKVETPKVDEPKVETPKEETPKVETPKEETPTTPTTPTTPEVNPVDAGMPTNAKWTRSQLQEWGYGMGTITGNYAVDGDLGLFNSQQAMEKAYNQGSNNLDDQYLNGTMTDAQYDNTPHGYAWSSVTHNGNVAYKVSVYDKDGNYNVTEKAAK